MSLSSFAKRIKKRAKAPYNAYLKSRQLPLLETTCLLEAGQGKNINGNMFALVRTLRTSGDFNDIKVALVTTRQTSDAAEQLLGKGDMLVKLRGKKPRRAQGCWVSDEEIESTVSFIREQVVADYHEDILTAVVPSAPGSGEPGVGKEDDPLVWEAARIVVESQLGSTSSLQRALSVGYARAGRIMDMLEAKGVVGPANGSKPREVLLDKEALEELRVQEEAYREVE